MRSVSEAGALDWRAGFQSVLFCLCSGLLACSSYLQGFFSCWHMPGGLAPYCLPSHQCCIGLHCNPLDTAVSVGGCLASVLFDGWWTLKEAWMWAAGHVSCIRFWLRLGFAKLKCDNIAKIFLLFWKEQPLVIQKLSLLRRGIALNYRKFIYTAQWEQKESLKKQRLLLESFEWNDNYNQVRLNGGENYVSVNGKVMCGSRDDDGPCLWV